MFPFTLMASGASFQYITSLPFPLLTGFVLGSTIRSFSPPSPPILRTSVLGLRVLLSPADSILLFPPFSSLFKIRPSLRDLLDLGPFWEAKVCSPAFWRSSGRIFHFRVLAAVLQSDPSEGSELERRHPLWRQGNRTVVT